MSSPRLASSLLLAALAAPVLASAATEPERLLTPSGAVVEVRPAQIDPVEGAATPLPALAVTVSLPGTEPVSQVVPGTESEAIESLVTASLAVEGTRANVLWIAREANGERRLYSRSVDIQFGGWLELRELLVLDLAADASEPVWTLTRDQYTVAAEDGSNPSRHSRDVVHLFWWAPGEGRPALHYSPVVLVDGKPIGSPLVFSLDELDQASAFGTPPAAWLFQSLAVERNGDEPRLGVVFLSPHSGRLLGVELQLLPGELSQLADRARGHIVDLGATLYPNQMATLAERARGHVIDLSSALHPAAAIFAADGVRTLVEGFDPLSGLSTLADRARGHIIDLVATPVRGGVATEAPATSVELFELPELASDGSVKLTHLLRARALRSWVFPGEVAAAEFASLTSSRGDAAILAWRADEGTLAFVESGNEGFGEQRTLSLATMDFEAALATLQHQLDAR